MKKPKTTKTRQALEKLLFFKKTAVLNVSVRNGCVFTLLLIILGGLMVCFKVLYNLSVQS